MVEFDKKCFFTAITFFSCSELNANPLKYISRNNHSCILILKNWNSLLAVMPLTFIPCRDFYPV